jgi:glycosyltransferase involved in cell wall biosynthesis
LLRALLVSSNWERKGGAQALAAVELARDRGLDVSLTVVGDHPRLPEWVRSQGRVSSDSMPEIYASHDVLLELATANAAGVTLTDAAHAGLPVIATRVGGVSTIVVDGVTGILVEPSPALAVEQAATALYRVADARERTRMAGEARKHAKKALDWSLWARQVLAMLPTSP